MTATLEAIKEQIRQGQVEQARQAIHAAEKRQEAPAAVAFVRGKLAESEHDSETALNEYLKVLETSPHDTEALFRAAWVADQCGDDDQAILFYQRCTSRDPAPVNALVNLAVLYEDLGRFDQALECLRRFEGLTHVREVTAILV